MSDLLNNLKQVQNSFDDIKSAIQNRGGIVGECDSIMELANTINNLPENQFQGTFMVFKQSSYEPDTPQGGRWTENGFEYPIGWEPTSKIRSISNDTYMSYGLVTRDNAENINWSTPIKISGSDGISMKWMGEFTTHPNDPKDGWCYKNSIDKKTYIYQDGTWYQMTVDGLNGQDGQNGISIVWKGLSSSPPTSPEVNWCYKDIDDGRIYIYNGNAWELMVVDGSDGRDGAPGQDGENGLSVFITYHDNPVTVVPSNPTNDGTTDGWHTNSTSSVNWMSQKVAYSAIDGEWGDPIQIRGASGKDGATGPLIYPAGIWNSETSYYASLTKAPYIYYEPDQSYYILNVQALDEGSSWSGTQFAPGTTYDNQPVWLRMDTFESIYVDIGIIKEALVGPAVFYGDYVFSQNGYTSITGDTITTSYELFNPNDPFGEGNEFYPNTCLNFKTGQVWLNTGKTVFNIDGSGKFANGKISWDSKGDLTTTIRSGSLGDGEEYPLRWDDDTIYIDRNLQFGTNSSISWGPHSVDITEEKLQNKLTKIGSEWITTTLIDSSKINTDELSVKKLDTVPDQSADHVHIENNYIHCINANGDKNLIISSDPVDLTKIRSLGTGYDNTTSSRIVQNITLTNIGSGTFPYVNEEVWYSHSSPNNLGYILAGSGINVYASLVAINVSSDSYNSGSFTQWMSAEDWNIQQGSGTVPYVVNNPVNYSGGCILIYKKNEDGDWDDYKTKRFSKTWYNASSPYSTSLATNLHYKTQGNAYDTITIDDDGEYGIRLGFEVGSIACKTSALKSMTGFLRINIEQNMPATYVEIGSDGMAFYDGVNSLKCTSDGVEMRSNSEETWPNFYGLRITSSGFKICNGGSTWSDWNPTT